MNWIFGDNINTDLITPGRYNITTDPAELARIAFIEHRPEFAKNVRTGDFVVGGNNFGCGSSRETAVTALKSSGIKAIIAQSFARIFYRNCMSQGMLAIVADTSGFVEDDVLNIDIAKQLVINKTQNKKVKAVIPVLMVKLHESGGMIEYLKKNGLDSIENLFSYKTYEKK